MRHLIALLIPGQPERLRRFKCRFTAPVLPGTRLCTQVWKVGEGEARFCMVNADEPEAKPYLSACLAEWE